MPTTINTERSYRQELLEEIADLNSLREQLRQASGDDKQTAGISKSIKQKFAAYKESFDAAFKDLKEKNEDFAVDEWFFRAESAMILQVKISSSTHLLDDLLKQFKDKEPIYKHVSHEHLPMIQVLDTLLFDFNLRSKYLEFVQERINSNVDKSPGKKANDIYLAEKISDIQAHVSSQLKRRETELSNMTEEKLKTTLLKYRAARTATAEKLSQPRTLDRIQKIFDDRFALALDIASIDIIEKILKEKFHFIPPDRYSDKAVSSMQKKFMQMSPQQLLVELERVQEQYRTAEEYVSSPITYEMVRQTEILIFNILKERTKPAASNANPQSPVPSRSPSPLGPEQNTKPEFKRPS